MIYFVVCAVALLASALTFFSGFGLGTLLLPAFVLFFPVEKAIALTAVVHFLNGGFKLLLVRRHVDLGVAARFGLPAIVTALLGAWLLLSVAAAAPMITYSAWGRTLEVTPIKFIVGSLLLCFSLLELWPRFRAVAVHPRYLPLGGALSGFFGGLSGMQGALRSAFLVKAGLTKETYVATGAAVAFLIDLARLSVYWQTFARIDASSEYGLLAAGVLAAFTGAIVGNRLLPKVTMPKIQVVVACMLFIVALGLMSGAL
jgi:uncharacterized protein